MDRCDPYEQYGVVDYDQSNEAGNFWGPISGDCRAIDYCAFFAVVFIELSLMLEYAVELSKGTGTELEFLKNTATIMMGDSIDRKCAASLNSSNITQTNLNYAP